MGDYAEEPRNRERGDAGRDRDRNQFEVPRRREKRRGRERRREGGESDDEEEG